MYICAIRIYDNGIWQIENADDHDPGRGRENFLRDWTDIGPALAAKIKE